MTKAVIRNSKRGLLFVDKIYHLTRPDSPKDFKRHALDELMREIDSHDPVMIFAGCHSHMESFIQTKPGLNQRIRLHFSMSDLSEIFLSQLKKHLHQVYDECYQRGILLHK